MKLVDIELTSPTETIERLEEYDALRALIRLHGVPIAWVRMPVTDGRCEATALRQAVLDRHQWVIIMHLLRDTLGASRPTEVSLTALLGVPHPTFSAPFPSVTVAVCTRDRAADLAQCLEALTALDYDPLEVLVVDNAPKTDATARLVADQFPHFRYVREPRPGLDWARNRAILEARGEIIAYTDDDVIVDRGWVRAIAALFAEHPDAMAVTGLVVPYELETEAQILFERYGGFGRGFERKWYRVDSRAGQKTAKLHGGSGKFGTGANMAYRRILFDRIGGFDPALDIGTVTNGGGDLEMFFRVLKEGHALVYEPAALVRHRHRREYAQLRTQLTNNGIGFYSHLVRSALAYPDERGGFIRLGVWWFWWWSLRRLLISFRHPSSFPRDLILAELWGSLVGLSRYRKAHRRAADIDAAFGPPERVTVSEVSVSS